MNVKLLSYGLLVGLAAGAASALFTAPQSGKELRGTIKNTKDNWSDHMLEIQMNLQQVKESIQQVSKEGKDSLQSVIVELKDSIQAWKSESDPAISNLQEELAAIQATMEELERSINQDEKSPQPS
ncbi:YtxH domain-containing protein [Jeotgalibacillus proteolyticus]|nr:YtxH domain-containing protein [Jeotgalibacillus proteolyticus]